MLATSARSKKTNIGIDMPIKVKICGLRDPGNIQQIIDLGPNFIGAVFYPNSKRFAGDTLLPIQMQNLDTAIKKVAVFVDSDLKLLADTVKSYFFNAVQLHGNESVEYCENVKKILPGIDVIKAFQISGSFDPKMIESYAGTVDYVLFDSASDQFGGSGQTFDWTILNDYAKGAPFFLSGGIGCDNIVAAREFIEEHPLGFGVDASSKLEKEPGVKAITLVQKFIEGIKS